MRLSVNSCLLRSTPSHCRARGTRFQIGFLIGALCLPSTIVVAQSSDASKPAPSTPSAAPAAPAEPAPTAPKPAKATKAAKPAKASAKASTPAAATPAETPAADAAPSTPSTGTETPSAPAAATQGDASGNLQLTAPMATDAAALPSDAASTSGEGGASTEAAAGSEQTSTPSAEGTGGTSLAPSSVTLPATPASEPIPTPGELGDRLVGDLSREPATKEGWTAPLPVLTLHGYLRVRGELMDQFWLGRATNDYQVTGPDHAKLAGIGPDPFSRFRPIERSKTGLECNGEGHVGELGGATCDVDTLQSANMRFRLNPQLNVSEDVRVKATFDAFDNLILGQGPRSFGGMGADTAFTGTDVPGSSTLIARRAWAEVRNRDLGELRFGIMPQEWGLGMLYNAGNRIDDDYSTDMGRVMGITKLAGFYLSASYDFISEGITRVTQSYPAAQYPALDGSQLDDVDQFSLSVVRRMPDEDEDTVLQRGDMVLNGGLHFVIRHQDAKLSIAKNGTSVNDDPLFTRLDSTQYTPDAWAQFRYRGFRLEFEGAWVLGHINDTSQDDKTTKYNINEAGAVLESELRLVDNKLGIYLYTGVASGDSDVEGLSSDANYVHQLSSNTTVSTFRFHPSYRVDTILWRSIMQQVTGAYYFKPGVSYDFVKDDFGQLFGARLDLIWSRAVAPLQTPGNAADLGVELNAQIYWRSDDGPDRNDGYHAALQYGVLFPMRGLGYYYRDNNMDTAQSLRLLLGVVF